MLHPRPAVRPLLTLLLIFATYFGARAQVHGGLKAGLNLSTLDGTINWKTDLRPAIHAGGFVTGWLSKHFALQPEVLYSQQGTKYGITPTAPTENTLRINTLNVPVLLKFATTGRHFNLHVGPQFALLLGAREERVSGNTTVTTQVKDQFKSTDYAIVLGVGGEVSRFSVDLRGIYGFSDINNDPNEAAVRARLDLGGLHHRLLQLSVGVRLF